MSPRRWSSAIWLPFVLLGACTAPNAGPMGDPWRPSIEVVNTSRAPVRVFVMVDGEPRDLGLVAADAQVRLALPREAAGAVVQFGIASPDWLSRTFLQPIFRFRPGMVFRLRLLPEDLPVPVRTL